MDRRDFIKGAAVLIAGAAMPASARQLVKEPTRRILFLADTHYCDDPARNPGLTWTANSNKNITAALKLRPGQVHWLGDTMDFNLSEYGHVRAMVTLAKKTVPDVHIHALMGNHEYAYYKWPEIMDGFPDDLPREVQCTLSKPAFKGQDTIRVDEDVSGVVTGHKLLMVGCPEDAFPPRFDIMTVKGADAKGKTITFTGPLAHDYSIGDFARQGWSNSRAINHFRAAFAGTNAFDSTTPVSTKYSYRTGNTLFIFLGTDQYHPQSAVNPELYCGPLSQADLNWLEDVIADNHNTCNIIMQTHINPAPGSDIGTADWHDSLCQYEPGVQARFKSICRKYRVPLWMFGHVHANWRRNFPPDKAVTAPGGPTYTCIKAHVAGESSRPGTGTGWQAYWTLSGRGGGVWMKGNSYTVNGDAVLSRPSAWGDTCFCLLPATGQMYRLHQSDEGQVVAMDLSEGLSSLKLKAYAVGNDGVLNKAPFRTETVSLPYPVRL